MRATSAPNMFNAEFVGVFTNIDISARENEG